MHLVGALRGGQPVGDRDRGPAPGDRVQRALQPHLGGRVDRRWSPRRAPAGRGRRRTPGPARPAAAPPRSAPRPARPPGCPGRPAAPRTQSARPSSVKASARSSSVSAGRANRTFSRHGGVEEEAVLRHHHHPASAATRTAPRVSGTPDSGTSPRVGSISRVSSFANVVLPLPGLADHRHPGPRRDRERRRRRARSGRPGRRTRRRANRMSIGPGGRSTPCLARVGHVGRDVEHVEHPPPAGDRVLRLVEHLGRDLHGLDEQRHQEQERGQLHRPSASPPTPSSTPTTTTAGERQAGGQLAGGEAE